jgi:hypothetical protein
LNGIISRIAVLVGVLLVGTAPLAAEEPQAGPKLGIELNSLLVIPLVGEVAPLLGVAGGARLSAAMGIGSMPLSLGVETSWDLGSINLAETLMNTFTVGPGLLVLLELGALYAAGSVGLRFLLTPSPDLDSGLVTVSASTSTERSPHPSAPPWHSAIPRRELDRSVPWMSV